MSRSRVVDRIRVDAKRAVSCIPPAFGAMVSTTTVGANSRGVASAAATKAAPAAAITREVLTCWALGTMRRLDARMGDLVCLLNRVNPEKRVRFSGHGISTNCVITAGCQLGESTEQSPATTSCLTGCVIIATAAL